MERKHLPGKKACGLPCDFVCNQRAVARNQIKIARYRIATESSGVSKIPL